MPVDLPGRVPEVGLVRPEQHTRRGPPTTEVDGPRQQQVRGQRVATGCAAGTASGANPASGFSSHARSGRRGGGVSESIVGCLGARELRGAEREWSTSDFGITASEERAASIASP